MDKIEELEGIEEFEVITKTNGYDEISCLEISVIESWLGCWVVCI